MESFMGAGLIDALRHVDALRLIDSLTLIHHGIGGAVAIGGCCGVPFMQYNLSI
jgi:hypothetical protein